MSVKGESFREIVQLRNRLNALFQEMLQPDGEEGPVPSYIWTPPADIFEEDDAYRVEMELPGVLLEDIRMSCRENILTVEGQHRIRREIDRENVQCMERYFGTFQRRLTFPMTLDGEAIQAEHRRGILNIRIPKGSARRRIEVT